MILLPAAILYTQSPLQIAVVATEGPRVDYAQALLETELQKSGSFSLVEREKIQIDDPYFFDLEDRRAPKITIQEEMEWERLVAAGETTMSLTGWIHARRGALLL